MLWDAGTTGVAHLDTDPSGVTVLAGFETEIEASAAADLLRQWLTGATGPARGEATGAGRPALGAIAIEPVDSSAWVDDDRRCVETVAGREIVLAPGAAFGDGAHPTTRLALALLADFVATGGPLDPDQGRGRRPLVRGIDFGAGTGVLTLAALAHGAAGMLAVENEPAAVAALRTNLDLNPELTEGRQVEVATALIDAAPADGDSSAPDAADPANGGADLVLANVLLPEHQEWGPTLARRLVDGGVAVATGVLVDQEADLLACYRGLTVMGHRTDGDWLGVVLGCS